nr:U5 small nuclear ribonucleoprotein helicase [Tanacetum cinerariifolium]
MLDGKLMLVDDDGKQLNKVDYAPVNSNSNSDVEVAFSETAHFMTGRDANNASLYEDEDNDIYDTYDIHGLTIQELAFCDMMEINLLVLIMEKGLLTAKGRVSGKDVKEKHNSVLDDSGTASHMVNEGIGSPYIVASNEEPKSRPKFFGYPYCFRILVTPTGNGADVVVLKEFFYVGNERLSNTLYGFFFGKHVAYPVVENYVKITWSNFGLAKSMMTNGMFFFKFSSNDEMESICTVFGHVLDDCPKQPVSDVLKNLKIPRQAVRGLRVGPKVLIMEKGFLTAKGRVSGKDVKEKHNSVLDDSGMASHMVNEGIGSPYTVASNEEPNSRPKFFGQPVSDVLKNLKIPRQAVRGLRVGPKVGFKPTKQVYRPVSQKNHASTRPPGVKKKQIGLSTQEQLNKVDYAPINSNSNSDVEVAYSETAHFMIGRGENNASLYEDEDYDIYDTYDIHGLTIQELALCDMMDI